MPLTYFHQSDEDQFVAPPIVPISDEGGGWWVGISKCAATIALAATISAASFSAGVAQAVQLGHQDDPAGNLSGQPDEDFWQNPVPPVKASNLVILPIGDPEEIPAASLHGQPDEDFWIPTPQPTISPPKIAFSDDDVIVPQPIIFQPEEDYWLNYASPVASRFGPLYLPDAEEIPAGSLFGQPDEDYWQNRVAPVPLSLLWPQPFIFDVQEPAGNLFGQPDEDLWQNWVRPVPAALAWPNPWQFDQDENAAGLHGQFDEDFWTNPVRPVSYVPPISAFRDEDLIVPQPPALSTDEDFWQNPVAPVQASFSRLYFPDAEQIAAGSLHGQPDEDYWQNPVAPIVWPNVVPPQSGFDVQEPAGFLFGALEETASLPLPVWSPYRTLQAFSDDDVLPASVAAFQPVEEYWPLPPNRMAWSWFASAITDDDVITQSIPPVAKPVNGIVAPGNLRGFSVSGTIRGVVLPADSRGSVSSEKDRGIIAPTKSEGAK